METSNAKVLIKDAKWFRDNEREWFYVICNGELHSVCNSKLEGLYLPSHEYASLEIVKAEVRIVDKEDVSGCHHFVGHIMVADRHEPIEAAVWDVGPSHVLVGVVTAGKSAADALYFYTAKQTAFYYVQYLRSIHPGFPVTWKKPKPGLSYFDHRP